MLFQTDSCICTKHEFYVHYALHCIILHYDRILKAMLKLFSSKTYFFLIDFWAANWKEEIKNCRVFDKNKLSKTCKHLIHFRSIFTSLSPEKVKNFF